MIEEGVVGRVEGKVALVTGAARGQGRAFAVRLAEEGADIVAIDACAPVETARYEMASPEDLEETQRLVESEGGRVVARQTDVRDFEGLTAAVRDGVSELGSLDIVVANAGVVSYGLAAEMSQDMWQEVIDINLTGTWLTAKAAIPQLNEGASLILVSSIAGLTGMTNLVHYAAAKHGIVGVMRTLAHELSGRMVRVNTIHPTSVDTEMVNNLETYRLFRPDLENPTKEDVIEPATALNLLPVAAVDPVDTANAVLFLASDEARYITGVTLPIDAGTLVK